ncbi:glycan-binding surface protein [Bacteroides faecium]|uniref:Surface glycan-binding protein B xyloglucan binding domain-containing protein n=1 Tax=Bacteroides faecium TaxID=2715212 RepID=A0A6H0KKS3_9BACE|nr:glycan-binding surface protein [Bacteroides faecium]QIU93960.1 hypothetical protein BacF7301_07290 [Bacteroides faecium]
MKLLKYIGKNCMLGLMLVVCLSACQDEDRVSVARICTQKVGDTQTELTKVRLGEMVRIEGSGFATTKAVYCNGTLVSGVNSNFITDTQIIFTVPKSIPIGSEVKNKEELNTIRIVTKYDDFVYPIPILGGTPAITGVSHTLAKAGEQIKIYGTNLRGIEKVTFPGGIVVEADAFTENTDYTTITVNVPEGGDLVAGELSVEGVSGGAYSYNYMNCKECVFINKFQQGDDDAYNYSNMLTAVMQSPLPEETYGEPGNPECYRGFPKDGPSDIDPILNDNQEIGNFRLYSAKMWDIVLANSNGLIKENTLCDKLAIQFDYYATTPWTTGCFRWEMIESNGNYRQTTLSWVESGEIVPVTFRGWRTLTMPLSEMTDVKGKTVKQVKEAVGDKGGKFMFKVGKFQVGGTYYTGITMRDCQVFVGNFRVVPYSKKPYDNN